MIDKDFIDSLSNLKAEIILPSIEAFEIMQSLFDKEFNDYIKKNGDKEIIELFYKGIKIYWYEGGVNNLTLK